MSSLDSKTLFEKVLECTENKDHEQAIELLSQYIAVCPSDAKAYLKRAQSYEALDSENLLYGEAPSFFTQKAIDDYEQAIRLDIKYAPIFWYLAYNYFVIKNWRKAIENLKQSEAMLGPSEIHYKMLSLAYLQARQFDDCIRTANIAVENNWDHDSDIRDRRGLAHLNLGNYLEAVQDFQHVIEKGIQDGDGIVRLSTHLNRGIALMKLGRYDEAINDFTFLFARKTFPHDVLLHRARCYQAIGKKAEAATDFKLSESYDPDDLFNTGTSFPF